MAVVLSFLLLAAVFRSLLVPATATVMNLLSAGAAFGVLVAVFGCGWLSSLVGVTKTGPIPPLVAILMFAMLFALSTDDEVFLISRIHEQWRKRRDNADAVNHGQAVAGKTITALACNPSASPSRENAAAPVSDPGRRLLRPSRVVASHPFG